MNFWRNFERTVPRPVEDGIKARAQRGDFGETWIGREWVKVLESFGWSNRLARGRRYARRGQVVDYRVGVGKVTAKVQGSRKMPYKVTIQLKPFSKGTWKRVQEEISAIPIYYAAFSAGRVPAEFYQLLSGMDLALLPQSSKELETSCSCPDWANPCKHIAAVCYLLGEAFDEDPFLLFKIRGISREELLESLAKERSGGRVPEEEPIPPDISPERFWKPGDTLSGVEINPTAPKVESAILRLLGYPKFLPRGKRYRQGLDQAYRLASGGEGE
jgi:uncharacterized Zn finger protein